MSVRRGVLEQQMARLKATKRDELGTHRVRRLRTQGLIPAIIYGHGKAAEPITLSEHDVKAAILHGERLLELDLAGTKQNVLIKDVQYDTFGQEVLHVDLARVELDERVEVTVPIVLRGTPAGADEGGVLRQIASEARIECLVRAIPEEIRVMVSGLNVGESIPMGDLELPEAARLLDQPDSPVCTVTLVAEEIEAPAEEEAPAQPEVVGEEAEPGAPEDRAGGGKGAEARP